MKKWRQVAVVMFLSNGSDDYDNDSRCQDKEKAAKW